jgi:hypothetical protein
MISRYPQISLNQIQSVEVKSLRFNHEAMKGKEVEPLRAEDFQKINRAELEGIRRL